MADESAANRASADAAQKPAAPKLQNVSRPQGVQRKPRKRRFPWPRVWVWAGTIVGAGFGVALVVKLVG